MHIYPYIECKDVPEGTAKVLYYQRIMHPWVSIVSCPRCADHFPFE
jgi:hypothetical protein